MLDERDGKSFGDGSTAQVKQLFKIDLMGAQDVSNLSGDLSSKAVTKTLFLDMVSKLTAAGIAGTQIPAKIEGLAFAQDIVFNGVTEHTLFVSSDNDFIPGVAGANKFYVFGFQDSDLAGFTQQSIADVPEPAALSLMLAGLAACAFAARHPKPSNRAQ